MSASATIVAAGAALAVLGWILPDFAVTIGNYIGLYSLVALGIVLLTGVTGVTSFGQAAFVGLAAYVSALMTLRLGLSPWVGLAAALACTIAAAALLGAITLRLSGHYLPLSTIAWGLSLYYTFGNVEALGGQTGITDIPPIGIGPLALETARQFHFLIWGVALAALWLCSNLLNSRAGRAMRSARNTRELAESFGIDTAYYRFIVFLCAAGCAGVSGWLYAHMLRFLNPTPFNLTMGIEYLFMAVIGGVGTIWGAILGAGVMTILRESLQTVLPRLVGQTSHFEVVVFGCLVIAFLQINGDRGIAGFLSKLFPRRKSSPMAPASSPLPPRPRDAARASSQALLRIEAVGKSFGGLRALNGMALSVLPGQIVGVIGPNGAGKSTLFNTITGLLEPDQGQLWINGAETAWSRPRLMVKVGIARTFQHVHLIPELSVLENVMLGAHIRGRAGSVAAIFRRNKEEEACLRAEALAQLERLGLGELADVPASSLALGQQRLMEIARALCADPDVLLLDEPAAGLRHREKGELAAVLAELRQAGLSILLVEHDMGFVMSLCDRITVMSFGEKLFEGSPAEVRANPAVIDAYLGAGVA